MPHKSPDEKRKYLREWMKRRRQTDPEFKARQYACREKSKAVAQERARQIVAEYQNGGCLLCHETEPVCLTFHHRGDSPKEIGIAQAVNRGWSESKLIGELAKCVCLCANCHRKVHAGHIRLPEDTYAKN